MTDRYDNADYELLWPRVLFVREATALLNHSDYSDWPSRCEFLLEDAFSGPAPRDAALHWTGFGSGIPNISNGRHFLRELIANAEKFREATGSRRQYWSQRRSGAVAGVQPEDPRVTISRFISLIDHLSARGYFEKAFGKDCVDDRSEIEPATVIEETSGLPDLWPLSPQRLEEDPNTFCDVIEIFHDMVARPRKRWMHPYAGCGWHHGDFSLEAGRVLYRWRVNNLLDRSHLGLRLAEEGEDIGRLVSSSDPARSDLLAAMAQRTDHIGDRLGHAIGLYRGRHADEHTKRSAIIALSGILEERRELIKAELLSKDEGDLFTIANKFGIRHQNEQQKSNYSVEFLDWIFWWYLATIELTDRLAAR